MTRLSRTVGAWDGQRVERREGKPRVGQAGWRQRLRRKMACWRWLIGRRTGSGGGQRWGVAGTRAAVYSEWTAAAERRKLPCREVPGPSAGRGGCWQWTATPPLSLRPGSKQSNSVSACQEGSRQSGRERKRGRTGSRAVWKAMTPFTSAECAGRGDGGNSYALAGWSRENLIDW